MVVAILSLALAAPSRAESLQAAADQVVIGIVVVGVAAGVAITLLVLHEKHKGRMLTGCVGSGPGGLNVTDDKDHRTYALSGNPPALTTGRRLTIEGRRKTSGNAPVFEAQSVTKDLGVCPP